MKRVLFGLFIVLVSCGGSQKDAADSDVVKARYVRAKEMAINYLQGIQFRSIAEKVEYCADIYSLNGDLIMGDLIRGEAEGCSTPEIPAGHYYVASLHTHANYEAGYASEIPSPEDMKTIIGYGIYGYLATPGGRIWEIDPFTKIARQLCSDGCVARDPLYNDAGAPPVPQTLNEAEVARYVRQFSRYRN